VNQCEQELRTESARASANQCEQELRAESARASVKWKTIGGYRFDPT